jgi:hypothetical protein
VGYFLCALVNGPDINHILPLAGKTCSVSSDWFPTGNLKCQQTSLQEERNRARAEKKVTTEKRPCVCCTRPEQRRQQVMGVEESGVILEGD